LIDADAFAALLCDWSVDLRAGDQALVMMTAESMPLVRALHRAVLERGGWPLIRLARGALADDFYRYAGERQLDAFAPIELLELQQADVLFSINAPSNTRALGGIDPGLIARVTRARAPLNQAQLAVRWCSTQWPTPALAQDAGIGERDYEELLERALFLDRPDPIAAWRELSERQERLIARLCAGREIRIEAERTDLTLRVDGRTWINSDAKHNMPSGEVFTGPVEDSASGTIAFTLPSNRRGIVVDQVELTFRSGEVVQARAARGSEYLQAALETDAGARRLGELGIGTNAGILRPTGSTLLDEKIAGTIHLALGRSYPETGGTNSSALHWDLVCDLRDGGRLTVDGEQLELVADHPASGQGEAVQ
jgi:aminopeptidase